MSRMYHNEPLSSIPVSTHHVQSEWQPKQYSGKGVILEGTILQRSRHVVQDSKQNKMRYLVLHFKYLRAHRRQFDGNGKEIEPNFSETEKVRQGYLHSSYKTVAKGETDLLTLDQVRSALACPLVDKLSQSKAPSGECLGLWIEEEKVDRIELVDGDTLRLKTTADCPFIESLAKLEGESSTVCNYAGGEQVGASWTDKVMSVKAQEAKPLPQDLVEGVDEDEWDD